jgi:hypothetical protein
LPPWVRFFRVLKQLLGLRHLLSQRAEGIDVQVYCTAIVCLLNHLNRPDNTGIKKRAKEELWKKLGY